MGSPYRVRGRLRLHGNDGCGVVSGESPSPHPSPGKGEGAGGSRGWVPVCTGTTVWALCPGSHPHPCPLPSRERGPEAAGDGFPFARERQFGRCVRGVTLTPALSRQGRGGRRQPGMGSRLHGNDGCGRCVRGVTLTPSLSRQGRGGRRQPGMGSPYRVRGRLRFHGNDGLGVVSGDSPSPQPSPVKGEGAGGSRGWVPRIEYGAGSVCTGTTVWVLCPGSHPHPSPLPSRERGPEAAGDGFPLKAGTTMWRTGTAVGWGRLVRRPGCPGLAG